MFDNAVVTNVGKQLLAQYVQGATLVFAQAKAGTGKVPVASLVEQTSLVTEKQTLSIVKKEVVTGGVRLSLQLTSQGVTSGYTLNQYGVYANVGGDNVLLAIVQDETGIAIPTFSDNPDFVVTMDLVVLMDNTGSFTVVLDTSALVTQASLLAALAEKSKVSASESGTSENMAKYITIDGVEYKLASGEKRPQTMEIITLPTKTQYRVGEVFNPAGMVARITYNDGTTTDVSSNFIYSDEPFSRYGVKAFRIGYEDVNAVYTTISITVNVIYGFLINGSESQPGAAVHYIEDAKDMRPAYMNFNSGVFDYGSWKDAFFMPRPCMLKSDGTVAYYLNPDDYTLREDGTPSDVADASFDGNAMMEWGQNGTKIWYKIEQGNSTKDGKVLISPYQVDNTYHAWSFINNQGVLVDHFYTPIYNGVLVNNKLRSLSGYGYGSLIQTKTAQQEVDYARANNASDQILWDTEVFADIQIINFLLILMGKSLNTQATFGYGRYGQSQAASSMLGTGTMNGYGLFWGHSSGTYGVKVFGMENWWGNQWRRYRGHVNANGTQKVKFTHGTQDGSTASDYNTDGSGYIAISGATPAGTSGGYINEMKFDEYGMHPKTASGSSSTYFCDGLWFNNGQNNYALRGGVCDYDARVGAFSCCLNSAAAHPYWSIGASVSCKPLAA